MTRRERLEKKLEKRHEWAGKAAARSDSRFDAAHKISSQIPMGQPILVGHHSERHARKDAERIHNNLDKGVEEAKLADHHNSKARGLSIQLDRTIFDDDPDAIEQLEARIARSEAAAAKSNAINKAWRKGGAEALRATGLMSEAFITETIKTMALCPWLKTPMSATGNRTSVRGDKERIERIKAKRELTEKASQAPNGVLIQECGNRDYVTLVFAEKPDYSIIEALKAAGFRWVTGSWFGPKAKLPPEVTS